VPEGYEADFANEAQGWDHGFLIFKTIL
jgi:hypothetical protein